MYVLNALAYIKEAVLVGEVWVLLKVWLLWLLFCISLPEAQDSNVPPSECPSLRQVWLSPFSFFHIPRVFVQQSYSPFGTFPL